MASTNEHMAHRLICYVIYPPFAAQVYKWIVMLFALFNLNCYATELSSDASIIRASKYVSL